MVRQNEQSLLDTYVEEYLKVDDVFRVEFMNGIILLGEGEETEIPPIKQHRSGKWPIVWSTSLPCGRGEPNEVLGPHIVDRESLFKAYRLYDDIYSSFMMTTRPDTGAG